MMTALRAPASSGSGLMCWFRPFPTTNSVFDVIKPPLSLYQQRVRCGNTVIYPLMSSVFDVPTLPLFNEPYRPIPYISSVFDEPGKPLFSTICRLFYERHRTIPSTSIVFSMSTPPLSYYTQSVYLANTTPFLLWAACLMHQQASFSRISSAFDVPTQPFFKICGVFDEPAPSLFKHR